MSSKATEARTSESGESVEGADSSPLDAFLPQASAEAPAAAFGGLRSARLLGLEGRTATVLVRGEIDEREVALDPEVDTEVVREALENGDRAMVEVGDEGELVVAGVLKARAPEKLRLRAEVIEIEAEREVLVRSGDGAMRIREDGDVELLGSRISAASRGLFRLVGRMLRLN